MTASVTSAPVSGTGSAWPLRLTLGLFGLLTMTPALALIDPGQLAAYGIESPDAVTTTLLQHRGVLQLALGAAIIWAAFDRGVRVPILLAATFTKGVGVFLTVARPEVYAASSGNVGLWFDMVCLVVLPAIVIGTLAARRRERRG